MRKIIWNITKKCGFHCNICATQSDERTELSYEEKRQVLLRICSLESEITELDFAGGDPLFDKDSKEIVREAIDRLGKDRISVTTTGLGVGQLNPDEKRQYLYKCELSLDDIGNCDLDIRNEDLYSKINLEAIHENKQYIKNITINIPIFDTKAQITNLDELVYKINEIKVDNLSVNILRYMPVGKAEICNYPQQYSPETYIDYLQKNLRKDIKIYVHCAMRGILGINNNCNMLIKKLGIDCEGNVFMCAWAGYLQDISREKNPFFLGNILEQDFQQLLCTKKMIEIQNKLNGNEKSCCIFSYLNSDVRNMFSNQDPLFMGGVK